jgi:nitrogen regulatory protein P-II 1
VLDSYMKKIETVIPHSRMETAFSVLKGFPIGGFTYYDSKGRGQIPTPIIHTGRGTSVYRPEFNVNVTISVVVSDALVEEIENKLLESVSTGLAGEGKIFVSEIDEAVDIGSGIRGEEAI